MNAPVERHAVPQQIPRRWTEKARASRSIIAAIVGGLTFLPYAAGAQVVEYYHLDAIGSTRAVSNSTGQVIERHDYLPYGEQWCPEPSPGGLCGTPPPGQPRRFTGKERDTETGLDYFGARHYGPRIARFTTVDPVYTWQENLFDPQRWNRYAYGRNNPFRYVDPDGREVFTQVEVLGAGLDYQRGVIAHQDFSTHFEGSGNALGGLLIAAIWGAAAAPALTPVAVAVAANPRNQQIAIEVVEGLGGVPSPGMTSANRAARTVTDRLIQHTTRKDLVGAAREVMSGVQHGGQHLKEVRDAARGLRTRIAQINSGLSNPNLSGEGREALTRELGVASRNLDAAEQAMQGRYIQHDN